MENRAKHIEAKAQHTAGPWYNDEGLIRAKAPEGGEVTISTVRGWDDKYASEENANARLIAAAPELLEALKGIPLGQLTPAQADMVIAALAKAGAA